jgi:hypothetical protein
MQTAAQQAEQIIPVFSVSSAEVLERANRVRLHGLRARLPGRRANFAVHV